MTIATLAVIESAVHDLLAGFLHGAAQRHACSRLPDSAPARAGGTAARLQVPALPQAVPGIDSGHGHGASHRMAGGARGARRLALQGSTLPPPANCDMRACHQWRRAAGPAGVVPDIQLGVILYTILGVATVVKVALYGARALP